MRYVLLVVALSGCTVLKWHRRGASQQDFLSDKYACKQENVTLVRYRKDRNVSRKEIDGEMFNDCMRARGWELREYPRE